MLSTIEYICTATYRNLHKLNWNSHNNNLRNQWHEEFKWTENLNHTTPRYTIAFNLPILYIKKPKSKYTYLFVGNIQKNVIHSAKPPISTFKKNIYFSTSKWKTNLFIVLSHLFNIQQWTRIALENCCRRNRARIQTRVTKELKGLQTSFGQQPSAPFPTQKVQKLWIAFKDLLAKVKKGKHKMWELVSIWWSTFPHH